MKPALFLLAIAFAIRSASAATLEVTVKDAAGAPIDDAVVWAMPKPGPAPARKRDGSVGQKDKTFIPMVTVVQTGTAVHFPNQDPIRHHVYSFSPAKPFEIRLYAGTPAAPIVFDKPGEVVLGCNIHDHMLAWIYVVDTPWFAKTGKDGAARIEGVPAGDYDLRVWHPAEAAPGAPRPVKLRQDEALPAAFSVALRALPPRPAAK